ncbi:MAG: cytochrome b [Alphaproteobacteria bacterium]
MALRNTKDSWGSLAKVFHWVIAVLVLGMIGFGLYVHELPRGPAKAELLAYHKSTGILILALMSARLLWRLVNPTPVLPPALKGWEKAVAAGTHWLLYGLVFLMPISGYVMTSAANVPFRFFQTFTVPLLVAPDRELFGMAHETHETVWIILAVALALHIGAALRHHLLLKDDVLIRMLPGKGRTSA